MTAEAFGRLASWSSFNIVVGRHDEFAHSRVAIPQKRGTTAKSIVLHFPPSHTLKLETPERRHSCHTRHSHYPRGRGMPRKNRQNTRSVPHPLAQIHAQCTAPPQSTTMTHFPPQSNTSHSRNPSLRGIAIERHAISSTHHNNRSYRYCLYISPFRASWSQQALRQLFKRHGNYMKLEYGTARSKRPRHVESEFSTSVLVSDTCRRGDEDQPSPPDQHTPFLLVTAPLSLTRTMMIAIIFNSDLELRPR